MEMILHGVQKSGMKESQLETLHVFYTVIWELKRDENSKKELRKWIGSQIKLP